MYTSEKTDESLQSSDSLYLYHFLEEFLKYLKANGSGFLQCNYKACFIVVAYHKIY